MKRATRIRKGFREALRVAGGAAIVALAGLSVMQPTRVDAQTLPLPALSTRVQPVVIFAVDTSGSMNGCDGGYVDETKDLTPAPSGGYLFDPTSDTSDDGGGGAPNPCNGQQSGKYAELSYDQNNYNGAAGMPPKPAGQAWTCPVTDPGGQPNQVEDSIRRCIAAGLGGRTMGTRKGTPGTRLFAITRLEAAKLAMSKILDVNGSGSIDSFDEQILRVKIGFTHFDTTMPKYNTSVSDLVYVGDTYNNLWLKVRTLHASGITPSGSFLIGTRHYIAQLCWDGIPTSSCNLGPGQNDPLTGDDLALACRHYYIIFLTDGVPNGGGAACKTCSGAASPPVINTQAYEDPITEAETLLEGLPGFTGDGVGVNSMPTFVDPDNVFPAKRKSIRTIAVGMSTETATPGTQARLVINCLSYVGAHQDPSFAADNGFSGLDLAADADLDADQDANPNVGPLTMSLNTNGTAETNVTCSGYDDTASIGATDFFGDAANAGNPTPASAGINYAAAFNGNGYFAKNATDLVVTFKRILNAIQAGTFTRSDPTLSAIPGNTSVTGEFIYTPTFVVPVKGIDWRGHFQKYKYVAGIGYEDCTTSTPNPINPIPCWDSGDLLRVRNFSNRTLYLVNPTDYASLKFAYEPDYTVEATTSWAGTDSAVPKNYPTVLNALSGGLSPNLATMSLSTALVPTAGTLYSWALMSIYRNGLSTYKPDGSNAAGITNQSLGQAYDAMAFAAGRPDSFFIDGKLKCGLPSCTIGSPTFKLGDSYNGRPVVVGPPIGLVSDPDYVGEFRNRPLSTAAFANPALPQPVHDNSLPYIGGDAPQEPPFFASTASACPSSVAASDCTVEKRRIVIYLPANDGALHAIDDTTGEELWSFIPPGHMTRLKQQLGGRTSYIDGLPTVRDVKFPCERDINGNCKAAGGSLPFEDGLWHTMLYMNQGAGGAFLFALDITNPVAPKFLWEYRDPSSLGATIAPPAVGDITPDGSGLTSALYPGSALFLPGGYFGVSGTSPDFHTLKVWNGAVMDKHPLSDAFNFPPDDLAPDATRPGGIVNGMTGSPRAIDADLDGHFDRVYFGDKEGRMWKACNILKDGKFSLSLFFDPAEYDRTVLMAGPDGVTKNYVGQPFTQADPTSGYFAVANGHKELRGPIYYAPDATRNKGGALQVAFGSGDLTDPIDVPTGYYNFVWNLTDNLQSGIASCDPAQANVCTGATALFGSTNIPYDTGTYSASAPACPCWVQSTNQTSITSPVGTCLNDVWPDKSVYNGSDPLHPNCHNNKYGDERYMNLALGDCACAKTVVSPYGVTPGAGGVTLPGTPSSLLTSNVVPLSKLMSSPAQFFNGLLFYSEFEPDPNVCGSNFKSRIYNLDAFTCGAPANPALKDSLGNPTVSVTFNNKLITGVDISPVTGTVFVQTSTPQDSPPAALSASGLKQGNSVAGWKQSN